MMSDLMDMFVGRYFIKPDSIGCHSVDVDKVEEIELKDEQHEDL